MRKINQYLKSFIKNLTERKRVLWIAEKYVVMDYQTWQDLSPKKESVPFTYSYFDQVSEVKDSDWVRLKTLLRLKF